MVSRWLYRLSLATAFLLLLLVFSAPWLDNWVGSRVLALFAHDTTLRRTALASAAGIERLRRAPIVCRSRGVAAPVIRTRWVMSSCP